jgi:hypothetical protein
MWRQRRHTRKRWPRRHSRLNFSRLKQGEPLVELGLFNHQHPCGLATTNKPIRVCVRNGLNISRRQEAVLLGAVVVLRRLSHGAASAPIFLMNSCVLNAWSDLSATKTPGPSLPIQPRALVESTRNREAHGSQIAVSAMSVCDEVRKKLAREGIPI